MDSETTTKRPKKVRLAPLTPGEWARVDRVARRLHGEITAFLAGLPPTARHASGLARHLTVDRTTCQRAVFVATRPYPGPELFARLPGVRGLRLMAEAALGADPPAEAGLVDGFAAAIDRYQELVSQLGRSTSQLIKRIALGDGHERAEPSADVPAARTALFDAATAVTGRASDCWVAVYVYRPSPTDAAQLEVVHANGLIGHTATADAVPLVVHNFTTPSRSAPARDDERFANLEHDLVEGRSPTVVLDDFTTDPPPLVTSRQPHEFLVQSIDESASPGLRAVDLMLAARTTVSHPAQRHPAIEEVWALVNFPARHLLFDVYIHRDLARTALPSLDTHLWGPDFVQRVGDRWQTRFTESPTLQLLDTPPRTSPPAYPRMADLTRHVFERSGLDSAEYVGHRCDVAYPLWRSGYCISFDFTRPDDDEG